MNCQEFKPEKFGTFFLISWFLAVKKDSYYGSWKLSHFVLVSNGAQLTCCDLLERGCSALLHALRHLHDELPPLSCCASSQVILKRQFITKYQAPVLKECLHFFNGFVCIFYFLFGCITQFLLFFLGLFLLCKVYITTFLFYTIL